MDFWSLTIIFFCFLVAFGMIFWAVEKLIRGLIAKFAKADTYQTTVQRPLEQYDDGISRTLLLNKFFEKEGAPAVDYRHYHMHCRVAGEAFMERLGEHFVVESTIESCSFDRSSCHNIIRLVGKTGKVYYVATSDGQTDIYRYDGSPYYHLPNSSEQVETFANEKNEIRMLQKFEIVYFNMYGETNEDLVFLYDTIKEYSLESILYEYPVQDQVRVYEMDYSDHNYSLDPIDLATTRLNDNANFLYAPVKVKYKGEDCHISPASAIRQASLALSNNRNVYIWGAPGTGKTTMLAQILAKTYDEYDDISIVKMTPTIFKEVQHAAGLSQFKRRVKELGTSQVLFVFDEVESLLTLQGSQRSEITSAMLQLLDGDLRTELNCNTVLVFNAAPNTLDPAVFRFGREGLSLELEPIPVAIAVEGVKYLQSTMPEKIFDDIQFQTIVNEESKDAQGNVYASKGYITLAGIAACFYSKQEADSLIDAIREAKLEFEREFKPAGSGQPKFAMPKLGNEAPRPKVKLPDLPGVSASNGGKRIKGYYKKTKAKGKR